MEDFQERVVDEKKELDEKIKKLGAFLSADKFKSICLCSWEAGRLEKQYHAMVLYSGILNERIINFN